MTATTKALFDGISQGQLGGANQYVFSTAQVNALKGLSEGLVSVAQIEGLGEVAPQQVKEARAL